MTQSEILHLFSQANRKCGYTEYADFLETQAVVKEAEEVVNEEA